MKGTGRGIQPGTWWRPRGVRAVRPGTWCRPAAGGGPLGRQRARVSGCLILALVALVSACSGSHSSASTGQPGGHGGFRRGGPVIIIGGVGSSGGGGAAVFAVSIGVPGFGGAGGGRPKIAVPPIPPAGQAVSLPLDSYEEVATQQQNALVTANDLLIQRCMTAAGFRYPSSPPAGSGALSLQSVEDQGYGLADLAQAQTYGYGQPGGPQQQTFLGLQIPGFVSNLNKHGGAWTTALLGFVPGAKVNAVHGPGCYRIANTELFGPLGGNPNPDPVPGIAFQAASWTQSDPRVLAAERKWSACVARRGFSYRSPQSAAAGNWPRLPTPIEISTAVADVECKTETNLVNIWLSVEAAYQQALVSQDGPALQKLQDSVLRLLRRAEQLLELPAGN